MPHAEGQKLGPKPADVSCFSRATYVDRLRPSSRAAGQIRAKSVAISHYYKTPSEFIRGFMSPKDRHYRGVFASCCPERLCNLRSPHSIQHISHGEEGCKCFIRPLVSGDVMSNAPGSRGRQTVGDCPQKPHSGECIYGASMATGTANACTDIQRTDRPPFDA